MGEHFSTTPEYEGCGFLLHFIANSCSTKETTQGFNNVSRWTPAERYTYFVSILYLSGGQNFTGTLSSVFWVSGGFVILPTLDFFDLPGKQAIRTSHMIISVITKVALTEVGPTKAAAASPDLCS